MTGSGNHTYLLVADDGAAVLVDAGVADPRHLDAIARQLDERRGRLRDVLVTHGHPDHAAGVTALARAHPAARFLKYPWPEEDARYLVEWRPIREGDRIEAAGDARVAARLRTIGLRDVGCNMASRRFLAARNQGGYVQPSAIVAFRYG